MQFSLEPASILGEHEWLFPSTLNSYFWYYLDAIASVGCEQSFSQYKYILNDRRESLTEENMKRLVML